MDFKAIQGCEIGDHRSRDLHKLKVKDVQFTVPVPGASRVSTAPPNPVVMEGRPCHFMSHYERDIAPETCLCVR